MLAKRKPERDYVIKHTSKERVCYAIFLFIPMIISYFLVFNHCMSTATLASDLKKAYSTPDKPVTDQQIADFASIYFYLYGFLQIVVGITVDNVGTHLSMGIANIIVSIGTYIIGLVKDINVALFGRALVAIGCAFVYIPICKWIAVWWPKRNFPLLVAISLVFGYGGSYCSTVPQQLLSEALGFKNVFILYGSVSLACGIIILAASRNNPMILGFPSPTIDDKIYEERKIAELQKKQPPQPQSLEQSNPILTESANSNLNPQQNSYQSDDNYAAGMNLSAEEAEENSNDSDYQQNNFETVTVKKYESGLNNESVEEKEEDNESRNTEAKNKVDENMAKNGEDETTIKYDGLIGDSQNLEKIDTNEEKIENDKPEEKIVTKVSIRDQFVTVFGVKENRTHVLLITFSHFFFMGVFFTMSASVGPRYLKACLPKLAESDPDNEISMTQSIITICCIFGAATSFLWCDYIGRRLTQLIAMSIYVVIFALQIMFTREKYSSKVAFSVLNGFTGYFAVVGVGCSYTHIKDKIDAKMAGVALGLHNMAMFISGAILQQAAAPQLIKDTMTVEEKRNGATYMAVIFFICTIIALTLMCLTKETRIGNALVAAKERRVKKHANRNRSNFIA